MLLANPLQTAARFPIMAVLAKGLPIVFIPEKRHIAAVRDNMVNNRRRLQFSLAFALRAQWMPPQEQRTGLSPPAVITACGCTAPKAIIGIRGVFRTIHAAVAQVRAPWIAAGAFWLVWHLLSPRSIKQSFLSIRIDNQ